MSKSFGGLVPAISELVKERGFGLESADFKAIKGKVVLTISRKAKVRETAIFTPYDKQIIDAMNLCQGCSDCATDIFKKTLDELLSGKIFKDDRDETKQIKYKTCFGNCPPVNLALSLGWRPQVPGIIIQCPECEEKITTKDLACPTCNAQFLPLEDESIPEPTKAGDHGAIKFRSIRTSEICNCTKCSLAIKCDEAVVIVEDEVLKDGGEPDTSYYHHRCWAGIACKLPGVMRKVTDIDKCIDDNCNHYYICMGRRLNGLRRVC